MALSWISIFALIYLYDSSKGSLLEFTNFINRTLVLNDSSVIYKFVLKSLYEDFMEPSVTCWLKTALTKQVDQLVFKFRNTNPPYFLLPQTIYSCNSLTTLSLSHCRIAFNQSSVFWRALKHLHITCAELDNKVLRGLLVGSPFLESLKLKNCAGFDNIDINSGRLKRLIINGYGSYHSHDWEVRTDGWLDINAPSLVSLDILGKKCRLKNVSSLAHAKLTFGLGCWEYEGDEYKCRVQDYQNMVMDLMEKVGSTENLTLGSWMVQVLSTCELQHLPIFISSRKRLVLETYLYRQDLPGIAILLGTSPVIEQLIFDVSRSHVQASDFKELCNISSKNYWSTRRIVVSQCLKTIKIVGFSESVIELVKCLLENAKALNYMIFHKVEVFANARQCYFGQEGYSFKILQNLLRFKRASPQAKIILGSAPFTPKHQLDQSDQMNTAPSTSSGNYGNEISIQKRLMQKRLMLQRKKTLLSEKSVNKAEQDRISDLPDYTLHHILTLLPLRDAMCTGLLSKRWNHLWASVPILSFRFELSTFRNEDHFISFVDKILILYNSTVIQRVKQLELLYRLSDLRYDYDIPSFLYTNNTIETLNLEHCKFESCGERIIWRSLRKLKVSRACLNDVFLAKVLVGCPVLERLELVECYGYQNLDIVNVGLKELVVGGDLRSWKNVHGRILRISAPYIKSLVITGSMGYKKLQTINLSSLVEACLDFTCYSDDSKKSYSEEQKAMVIDILASVCHVEKLTLRTWCLQVFSSNISNPVPSPFLVCKSLILKANNKTKWCSRGIVSMLHCCPELEALTIDMSRYTHFEFTQPVLCAFGYRYCPRRYDNINCLKQRLGTVKIFGMLPDLKYYDFSTVIRGLLKEAKVMKKLCVIKTKLWKEYMCSRPPVVRENEFFDLGEKLLSSERSSPLAEIVLSSEDKDSF